MPQQIQSVKIRTFTGISTKVNATDTPPGTLFRGDGINTVPSSALSFGPSWLSAWNQSALGAAIAAALSGGTANRVHFVTVALGSTTFLVAWNMTSNLPRGIFHVSGTGDPNFTSTSTVTITATNNSVYRDHTDALPWYGCWVQNRLFLGNGTDTNLVWKSGALAVLGPASLPSDAQDPSQYQFPPCTSFLVSDNGAVYGAGNVTHPKRIWAGEVPSVNCSINEGIKTTAYSWVLLGVNATRITALSSVGTDIVAHLDVDTPMIVGGYNRDEGGWKLVEQPTTANAGAINPNCARDTKTATSYLGSDLELYRIETYKGSIVDRQYSGSKWRKIDILTDKASGVWNAAATKPINLNEYGLIFDEKNGRTWLWLHMTATARQGLYCFDERTDAITGPWWYPDFVSFCQLRDENLNGCLVAGITRDGAFLWADLGAIGDYALPSYLTALPAACVGTAIQPTSDVGIGWVGVDAVNNKFMFRLGDEQIYMADPWSDWKDGGITPTVYYNNARVAVVEFAEGDCSSPALQKEFLSARLILNRNSILYYGAYAEVNGYRSGAWRGLAYPSVDWLAAIGGEGSTYRLRLIIVTFNNNPQAVLSGLNVDFLPSVTN